MNARNITMMLMAALLVWSAMLWSHTVAAAVPPDQVARTTAEQALGEIRSRNQELKNNPDKLYQLVEDRILSHFDFDRIDQFVLGQSWRQATPDQRARFSRAFQHMLVRSYSQALLGYRDETIEWEPLRMPPGAQDVVVKSRVNRKEGPPVPVNYSMYLSGGEWKVYDVTVDAISLATGFRSSFAAEVKKNGIDGLIQALEQKQSHAQQG